MTPLDQLGRALRSAIAKAGSNQLTLCGIENGRARKRGRLAVRFQLHNYVLGGRFPIATVAAGDEQTAAAALLSEIAAIRKELTTNETTHTSKRSKGMDQARPQRKATEAA